MPARKDQDHKLGSGPLRSITVICNCITLFSEFHSGFTATYELQILGRLCPVSINMFSKCHFTVRSCATIAIASESWYFAMPTHDILLHYCKRCCCGSSYTIHILISYLLSLWCQPHTFSVLHFRHLTVIVLCISAGEPKPSTFLGTNS